MIQHCMSIGNFTGAMTIVSGLKTPGVERLKGTQELLSAATIEKRDLGMCVET